MVRDLMVSWHLNIWKVKIWLSQQRKELLKWNKKLFPLFLKCSFRNTKQTSKNVANTTFQHKEIINLEENETDFQKDKFIVDIIFVILLKNYLFQKTLVLKIKLQIYVLIG